MSQTPDEAARGPLTLDAFEQLAIKFAQRVNARVLDLNAAAAQLCEIAQRAGLAAEHGAARVQDRMEAGFRAADRLALGDDGALPLTCLADVAMHPIEWLWPERIAIGKVTEIAGEGGIGKSSVSLDLAARVSRGAAWPDGAAGAMPGSVFILSTEDDPSDTMKPRLQAAGADMRRIFWLSVVRERRGGARHFDLKLDLAQLEDRVRAHGDVRAVMIDPITGYLGNTAAGSNTGVRRVLDPLGEMAARRRVAVIGITHFGKSRARSANARILDSVAFVNQARSVIIVTRDPHDRERRLFLCSKQNLTASESGLAFRIAPHAVGAREGAGSDAAAAVADRAIATTRVLWEEEAVVTTADEALAAQNANDPGEKSAKDEAIEFLRDILAEGPKPTGLVLRKAQAAGIGRKSMLAARQALRIKPQKDGYQGEWVLALPKSPLDGSKSPHTKTGDSLES